MDFSTPDITSPTDAQRRLAVCNALVHSPRLLRAAVRVTGNVHDAEDAYQRAMEIALRSAPVVEPDRFLAWLRTVLRNEAIAVVRQKRREGPGRNEDACDLADRNPSRESQNGLEEWRHRYRTLSDILSRLTEAQRVCLVLQARGASYSDISEATGFSARKVERSVLEGRAALRRWETAIATGEACERTRHTIDDVVTGEATRLQVRRVERHVRHCGHCLALLRARRRRAHAMSSLAPVCLLPPFADLGPADPGPMMSWWERASLSGSVRAGNAVQMVLEAPGPMALKVGAAVAFAGVTVGVGVPLLPIPDPSPSQDISREIATALPDTKATRAFPEALPSTARTPSILAFPKRRTSSRTAVSAETAHVAFSQEPFPARIDVGKVEAITARPAPRTSRVTARVMVIPQRSTATTSAPSVHGPPSSPVRAANRAPRPSPTPRRSDPDVVGAASISIGPSGP